jgi:putative hemolysin
MKIHVGAAMTLVLLLSACAAPKPAAPTAADGAADQAQTASAQPAKKHCAATTGSRFANCDAASPDVQGVSGDAYRANSMMTNAAPGVKPN